MDRAGCGDASASQGGVDQGTDPSSDAGGSGEPAKMMRSPVLRVAAYASSASCVAISAIVMMAWHWDVIVVASVSADYVPMTLGVAVMVLLLSLSLLIMVRFEDVAYSRIARAALAGASLLLALTVLLQPVLHTNFDIEAILHPGSETAEGYLAADTSPISAASLVLASAAALLSLFPFSRNRIVGTLTSFALMAVLSVGLVTILGYAYDSPLLYGGDVRPVSLLAGVCLSLVSIAQIASLGPDKWPVSIFAGPSVRARLLRAFVPLVALVVLANGALSIQAQAFSANPALTASLLAILTAIVVGALVARLSGHIGNRIDRADALRRKAEAELRKANQKLTVLGSVTRHDALNQLSVVLGRLELLTMKSKDPEVLKQVEESLRSANTIRAILEFTGQYQNLGVSGPMWIDVAGAFGHATAGIEQKGVKTRSEVQGLQVLADIMFEKVLVNFVDNSLRHGERVKNIRLSCSESEAGLLLVYEDDGVGLSAEDKANLFKRGAGRHTGFGMYLSKEILEFSGLGICETGVHEQGARFEIAVPKGKYRLGRTDI